MSYVLTGLDPIITSPYIPSPVYAVPSGFLKINKENMVVRQGDSVPSHALYAELLTVYSTDIVTDEEGNIVLDGNGNPTFIVTESTVCGTEPFSEITECVLEEHKDAVMDASQSFFNVNSLPVCVLGDASSCDTTHLVNISIQEFFSVNQA